MAECLIVDDEPDLCWALERLLTSKGWPCQVAQTAQAALDLVKSHQFRLAFLDVTLPDMNGLDLAKCLRKSDPLLRIVILSGYLSNEAATVAVARREGLISAYFKKPFSHEEILQIIQHLDATQPRPKEAASLR
jgi:DNA-binding NtrC family response regulator